MQSNTSVQTFFFFEFMMINNKNVGKHLKFGTWLFVNIITHYVWYLDRNWTLIKVMTARIFGVMFQKCNIDIIRAKVNKLYTEIQEVWYNNINRLTVFYLH